MKQRIKNFLICIDQLIFSIITLGKAMPDETMSSAAWRMERDGKFFKFMRPIIDVIFGLLGDEDHCRTSYESELEQAKQLITNSKAYIATEKLRTIREKD